MKKTIYVFIAFFSLLLVFTGCKKNALGGKAKVRGTVAHHGKPISGAVVYIKFNATEFPGDDVSVYDSNVTANASGFYEINNFYKGNYYLYAVGFDPAIASPYIVKGGVPVKIRSKEELNIDIPVGEE